MNYTLTPTAIHALGRAFPASGHTAAIAALVDARIGEPLLADRYEIDENETGAVVRAVCAGAFPYAWDLPHEQTKPILEDLKARIQAVLDAETAAEAERLATPPVPEVLSRAQFIIAARKTLGITEGHVFALISQLPKGEEQEDARDLWENAGEFRRGNSFLAAIARLNGNTAEQIDEVFRTGAALNLD